MRKTQKIPSDKEVELERILEYAVRMEPGHDKTRLSNTFLNEMFELANRGYETLHYIDRYKAVFMYEKRMTYG